jgi:glycosyltransferase involved in cell wall biosynthesis
VLPSKYGETWGLVVNEAMASGLPVLVSDQCGCAAELVEDGVNGFVFDPENNLSLSYTLQKFLSLADEARNAMGKRSEAIIRNWSLDRFSQAAYNAITHCVNHPKPPPNFFDSMIIKLWKGRYRPT